MTAAASSRPVVVEQCLAAARPDRVKRLDHLNLDVYAELLIVAAAQHAAALTHD